jgi:hypothetical protein
MANTASLKKTNRSSAGSAVCCDSDIPHPPCEKDSVWTTRLR